MLCRLDRLELGFCGRGFGEKAAAALAAGPPLTGLQSLHLAGAYRLQPDDVLKVVSAAPAVLSRYERQHRLATWPLYQATNLLVNVYTNDRLPARLLRGAGLRVAQGLLPLRKGIARHLTARG